MSIKIEGGGSKENVFSDSETGMPLWNGAPLLNLIYPVGSIYWSSNSTNPGTLFGGTWTQIKDRFILAAGDSYSNGATGGAATVTLTVSNMPSHSHSFTPSGTVSSHTHSFTPSGTVGSHTHSFTPSGTVSSAFTGSSTTSDSALGQLLMYGDVNKKIYNIIEKYKNSIDTYSILDLEKELSFELVRAEPEIFSRKEKLAPKLDGGDNGIGDILAKYKK